jgi:hypothetical protein
MSEFELANKIFDALFDKDDLKEMRQRGFIAQEEGFKLSSIAVIQLELDGSAACKDGWISVDGYDGDDVVDLWCVAKDCQFRGADFRLIDGVWISENSDLEISRHFGNVGVTATHFMIKPKPPKVAE